MFTEELLNFVSALTWWESQITDENNVLKMCRQLMTAVASSAGVERVFSSFGFVHSKVRNRLGIEKGGKLVFMYKLLNGIHA